MKRWRWTERFNLSDSPLNIHPLDNGLPSLSLHALLAQSDINTLMPASSPSTLSLKKDELRVRTDPFPCFIDKTYQTCPRSNTCVSHPTKNASCDPRLEEEVWLDFYLSIMENSLWSFFNSKESLGLISTFPMFLQILNYFHIHNTRSKTKRQTNQKETVSNTEKSLWNYLERFKKKNKQHNKVRKL